MQDLGGQVREVRCLCVVGEGHVLARACAWLGGEASKKESRSLKWVRSGEALEESRPCMYTSAPTTREKQAQRPHTLCHGVDCCLKTIQAFVWAPNDALLTLCLRTNLPTPTPYSHPGRSKQGASTAWGSGLLLGPGKQRAVAGCIWVALCSRRLWWARRGSSPNPTLGGCRLPLLPHVCPNNTARKWKGK